MKMLIPAKVSKIVKDDILVGKYNMFEIDMHIDEIGVDLKMELGKYDISDSADAFNIELFGGCAEFCSGKAIVMNGIEVDSKTLALVVSSLFIDALVKASEKGAPFKVNVSLPKDKKKAFEAEIKENDRLKKSINKDKGSIVEVNADTIMNKLNSIEKQLLSGVVISKDAAVGSTNTPVIREQSNEVLDPSGNLESTSGIKRATLDFI